MDVVAHLEDVLASGCMWCFFRECCGSFEGMWRDCVGSLGGYVGFMSDTETLWLDVVALSGELGCLFAHFCVWLI